MKQMSSRNRLMVFLVSAIRFIAKNLAAFLIVESLIEGYMLIASTDAIVTSSLFTLVIRLPKFLNSIIFEILINFPKLSLVRRLNFILTFINHLQQTETKSGVIT